MTAAGDGGRVGGLPPVRQGRDTLVGRPALPPLRDSVGPGRFWRVRIKPGQHVLDVAAGTGNVAIRAAEAGARVVASDLTPENFDAGRDEACRRDVELDWVEADAEALPFADGEFDVVTSSVGAIFAPDHQAVADELVRVCRPGGTIGMLNFTPEGLAGRLLRRVRPLPPPPPPGALPPLLWGSEEHVRELFGDRATLEMTRDSYVERAPASPREYVEVLQGDVRPCGRHLGEPRGRPRAPPRSSTTSSPSRERQQRHRRPPSTATSTSWWSPRGGWPPPAGRGEVGGLDGPVRPDAWPESLDALVMAPESHRLLFKETTRCACSGLTSRRDYDAGAHRGRGALLSCRSATPITSRRGGTVLADSLGGHPAAAGQRALDRRPRRTRSRTWTSLASRRPVSS